jgi:hypothetical protein
VDGHRGRGQSRAALVQRLMKPDLFNGWGIRNAVMQRAALQSDGLSPGHRLAPRQLLIAAAFGVTDTTKKRPGFLSACSKPPWISRTIVYRSCSPASAERNTASRSRYPVACHPQGLGGERFRSWSRHSSASPRTLSTNG